MDGLGEEEEEEREREERERGRGARVWEREKDRRVGEAAIGRQPSSSDAIGVLFRERERVFSSSSPPTITNKISLSGPVPCPLN